MIWNLDIKLESLADGPGLLPYRLGTMRLTTHHHTFLQYVNLKDIEDKINFIQTQLRSYQNRLINDTFTLYELQIDYLYDRLDKVLYQLQTLEPNRAKRGLVDGLGSVIKGITGNLDQSDALKYNEAIKSLQNNQDEMLSKFNGHISLSKEWMVSHNKALTQLVDNQRKINETLYLILNSDAYRESSLIKYARFAQLLEIISENTEDLMQELLRIENTLAFIHLSTTHHSMIDIKVLQYMLNKVRVLYGSNYIPDLELREFYDIIKPGSFYINKQIVIVFKFPIISKDSYELFKLAIAPNKDNQGLIPPSPFIATYEKTFVYIETECPKLNSWYLCDELVNLQIRSKNDCIQEVITSQRLQESCQFAIVILQREAMEKLDDRHYVLSFPHQARVQLSCGRVDYISLHGSYLATIPVSCQLKTEEFTIVNDNDEIEGQPLKLTGITKSIGIQSSPATHIQLNSINLQDLHGIQERIMAQTPLQHHHSDVVYHTTLPFYTILSIGSIVIIIIILYKYKLGACKKKSSKEEDNKEDTSGKMPATFSLSVLK
ncbi:uncharacterized protein [Epargyreus clarus]|uniref:uncharacterized protein n=1 Tax=Epargyreus clarus TaxID=520877 RepID=UPI003C2B6C51